MQITYELFTAPYGLLTDYLRCRTGYFRFRAGYLRWVVRTELRASHEICESSAGGGQGNPLTSISFPVVIDKALKTAEPSDVEPRAQQGDIHLWGDLDEIFRADGTSQHPSRTSRPSASTPT